MTSCDP